MLEVVPKLYGCPMLVYIVTIESYKSLGSRVSGFKMVAPTDEV